MTASSSRPTARSASATTAPSRSRPCARWPRAAGPSSRGRARSSRPGPRSYGGDRQPVGAEEAPRRRGRVDAGLAQLRQQLDVLAARQAQVLHLRAGAAAGPAEQRDERAAARGRRPARAAVAPRPPADERRDAGVGHDRVRVPWTSSTDIGRDGEQSRCRSPPGANSAAAAIRPAMRHASTVAMNPPFEIPDTYTRDGSMHATRSIGRASPRACEVPVDRPEVVRARRRIGDGEARPPRPAACSGSPAPSGSPVPLAKCSARISGARWPRARGGTRRIVSSGAPDTFSGGALAPAAHAGALPARRRPRTPAAAPRGRRRGRGAAGVLAGGSDDDPQAATDERRPRWRPARTGGTGARARVSHPPVKWPSPAAPGRPRAPAGAPPLDRRLCSSSGT